MRRGRAWLVAVTAIVTACGDGSEHPESCAASMSTGPVPLVMPTLRRLRLHIDPDFAPEEPLMPLAVSDSGHIIFLQDRRQHEMALTMVDSSGRLIGRFARRGSGPGEVYSASYAAFIGSSVLVVDNDDQARLLSYDASLQPGMFRSLRFGWRIVGRGTSGLAAFLPAELGGPRLEFIPVDESGVPRRLIGSSDTLFAEVLKSWGQFQRDGPPVAIGPSGLVLGDGMRYRLYFHDSTGQLRWHAARSVPPRRRSPVELAHDSATLRRALRFRSPDGRIMEVPGVRDRMARLVSDPLPYFGIHSLAMDATGRLWVIGTGRDSTFVDIWADTLLVGRKMLPCRDHRGAVSPDGTFIALLCEADDDSGAGADVQLYRVEQAEAR